MSVVDSPGAHAGTDPECVVMLESVQSLNGTFNVTCLFDLARRQGVDRLVRVPSLPGEKATVMFDNI